MNVSEQLLSFNRSFAMERVGGDEELLREIAVLFLGEYPGLIEDIGVAVATSDPDRLQRAAHTLKGSLGTLGAERAYPLALELEMKGRHKQMDGASQYYQQLLTCIQSLHEELASLNA